MLLRRELKKFFFSFFITIIFINCSSIPVTTDIHPIKSKNFKIREKVIINSVSIPALDSTFGRYNLESKLEFNLKNFLERENIFKQVILHSETEDNDKSNRFNFNFTEYKTRRKANPLTFLFGILTLGIYLVVGPIAYDNVHFICEMEVLDYKERSIFKTIREIKQEKEIGIFSRENLIQNAGEARALLFLDLINEYKDFKYKK